MIASGDSANFGRKPSAGLAAIMSAKSCSECVEIRITDGAGVRAECNCSTTSNPLSAPRSTSTRVTSGRRSR